MAFLVGATVGGFLLATIIGWLVEKFAFRQLPPTQRASWTMFVAWLVISAIAGLGMADGGPFVWFAGFFYIPGTLIAWWLMRRRLLKMWHAEDETDTFA